MNAYVDTGVMLARYIPGDPENPSCSRFFERIETNKFVSVLSILELSCVFSRLLETDEVEVPPEIEESLTELSREERIRTMVEYVLEDCGLRTVEVDPIHLTISLLGSPTKISHVCYKALNLASELRLRTLDILHLAHISSLVDEGVQIECLVTNDSELLARRKQISEILRIRVLSVKETLMP
ncbi:MAG: hypothetical protein V1857_04640 [archaeon]